MFIFSELIEESIVEEEEEIWEEENRDENMNGEEMEDKEEDQEEDKEEGNPTRTLIRRCKPRSVPYTLDLLMGIMFNFVKTETSSEGQVSSSGHQ